MRRITPILTQVALAALAIVGGSTTALAQSPSQGVQVTAPAPSRPAVPELGLQRTMPLEERGIREQEFYPGLVRSRHEPAFVTPFVATIPTSESSGVRVGLSGWTAPALPFDIPQSAGGVAFGFTLAWGVPLPQTPAPAPEPAPQR